MDRALARLAQNQNPDGSWNSGGFGGNRDPAVTALCVMSFLSAGHVPGEGPYGDRILKGVRYVCSQQQTNGVFAGQMFGNSVMYSHGICTLMVAEVVGLMPRPQGGRRAPPAAGGRRPAHPGRPDPAAGRGRVAVHASSRWTRT